MPLSYVSVLRGERRRPRPTSSDRPTIETATRAAKQKAISTGTYWDTTLPLVLNSHGC